MQLTLALLVAGLVVGCSASASPTEVELLREDLKDLRRSGPRPASPAGTYRVQRGDTLWSLARRWHVSVAELKRANGLTGDTIRTGQELVIPSGAAVVEPRATGLSWPVPSSRQARGEGDALVVYASEGAVVVAAGPGLVSYVSERVRGLGKVVMVEHPDGLLTMYGRLGEAAVRAGQYVQRGQPLGQIGPGGPRRGPRLRFMVFRDARAAPVRDYLTW